MKREFEVTLLGDAAHPTTPNFGQGACQAIEDGFVIAQEFAKRGDDVESALRAYEGRRRGRANMITVESRRYGAVSQWDNPVLCWFRSMIVPITMKGDSMRLMKELMSYEV